MTHTSTQKAGVATHTGPVSIGREKLLGIPEICSITGLSPVTASKLMKESGRAIRLHTRLYMIESSFYAYLHEMEVTNPCRE